MRNNKTTYFNDKTYQVLIEEGFHEVTEKEEEWYKVGIQPISCKTETEKEFERLCKIKK